VSKKDNPTFDDDEIASVGGDDEVTAVIPDETLNNSAQLKALAQQLDAAKKDYLYLRADFDNYKKAAIKERADLIKYGQERAFVELLDVLDTFERALELELTPENLTAFKEGMVLTSSELKKMLERFGVREINCLHQPFDPNQHDALSSEESAEIEPGHVLRVFKKAYKLHDRFIRPAQVVVAKAPKQE